MKHYAWSIDYYTRKGAYHRTVRGILKANSEDEALEILWNKMGNDFACNPCVGLLDMDAEFITLN